MKYIEDIVIAEKDFCVPAVIEMTLKHYGISNILQKEIAAMLEINPSKNTEDQNLWGAVLKKNSINEFFIKKNIPLHEKYIPVDNFEDEYYMVNTIKELLDKNITIICGYNYSWLFGKKDTKFGHVSIIIDLSLNQKDVQIIDPGPNDPGIKWVEAYSLFRAINSKKDGLWCINEITYL